MKLICCLLMFLFFKVDASNTTTFKASNKGITTVDNTVAQNWVAKHDMSGQEYTNIYKELLLKGFIIDYIDGHYINGNVRYAAIWKKDDGSLISSRHGLTSSQYQAMYVDHKSKGFRLIHIDGYSTGNGVRYAAIWKKKSTAGIRTAHGLTDTQYQNEFSQNDQDGYRLIRVSGYELNGTPYYAAIWKKGNTATYKTHHRVPQANYQQVFDGYINQGYIPFHINAYTVNGNGYYACIFRKKSGQYSSFHNLSPANYQLQIQNYYYQSFNPVCISAYDAGSNAAYSGIFVK